MPVDTQLLSNQLSQYGSVVAIGVNNPKSYIVAIENTTATVEDIVSVIDSHILQDYPVKGDTSLIDGIFKTIYFNQ